VHEPDPDTAFVPGAAKRNLLGWQAEKDSTAAIGLPIAFGAEMNEP